jgi:hypothetical protein
MVTKTMPIGILCSSALLVMTGVILLGVPQTDGTLMTIFIGSGVVLVNRLIRLIAWLG